MLDLAGTPTQHHRRKSSSVTNGDLDGVAPCNKLKRIEVKYKESYSIPTSSFLFQLLLRPPHREPRPRTLDPQSLNTTFDIQPGRHAQITVDAPRSLNDTAYRLASSGALIFPTVPRMNFLVATLRFQDTSAAFVIEHPITDPVMITSSRTMFDILRKGFFRWVLQIEEISAWARIP
ncbi:hypothetical protein K490DRAFT_57460 [Saccharata proteae CBS 121410]|uniref:Uncharacterized protein n=1 Tax=Saccharata proteae CBS 121410 TaxID=1314787 RepID=A0A9P4HV24_9PEZI|nr:hypothetical protein K490DRAFT_57460 [Saccharata proteae CBS 121410]